MMIVILSSSPANSVQDLGRFNYLSIGVSRCGAMDRQALQVGNALLGNEATAAGIEVAVFPFRIRFDRDVDFALMGANCTSLLGGRKIPPCWAVTARKGDELIVNAPTIGARAYLVVRGGIDVPLTLNSRSTDQKAKFGGLDGRGLQKGDRLAIGDIAGPSRLVEGGMGVLPYGDLWADLVSPVEIRFIGGPEYRAFSDESVDAFHASNWIMSNEANRQGYRLIGPKLEIKRQVELFSHGIVSGTVQVPPSGQPIIQLSDANTCGGYPKIAAVIEADLWKLAQLESGSAIKFQLVTVETARTASEALDAIVRETRRTTSRLLPTGG